MSTPPTLAPAGAIDLASAALGGRALFTNDDFFAPRDRLLDPAPARWEADRYTDRGKWMDGWESRRRRSPGHDWCIIALGAPGQPTLIDVDTSFFLGNAPGHAWLLGAELPADPTFEQLDEIEWFPIAEVSALRPGSHNLIQARAPRRVTHLKLFIHPDGGVARLRVWGRPALAPELASGEELFDLAAAGHGARALACSDMFFGDMNQLLLPQRAEHMGQGWETKRRRSPGRDWVTVSLATRGRVHQVELDTAHFKGNFADRATLEGVDLEGASALDLGSEAIAWRPLLRRVKLSADHRHFFEGEELIDDGPFTHLRLTIFPDGGVSRLRVVGRAEQARTIEPALARLVQRPAAEQRALLMRCCGAHRWVEQVRAAGPYPSRQALFSAAERIWWTLSESDWREAFSHHPRIGGTDQLRARFASTAGWSSEEQAGAADADEHVLEALARGNAAYEQRFGFIFIVCASGLSASEMLERLEERLPNRPEDEVRIAAGEQAKITRLRLSRALGEL